MANITIQRTNKSWKILKFLSFVILLAGLIVFFGANDTAGFDDGFKIIGLAFGLNVFARIGKWWTND